MSTWILAGTLIAIYSPAKKRPSKTIFRSAWGCCSPYYLTAMLTHGGYGWSFILGWTVFACFSPAMAYLAWMTKQCRVLPKIIGAGILLFPAGQTGLDSMLLQEE